MVEPEKRQLRRLAALHRVQTSYIDMHGKRCWAKPEALLAVLQELREPLAGMADVDEAVRVGRERRLYEWVPSVIVAWEGKSDQIQIRIPASSIPSHAIGPRLQYTLHLENGDIWSGNVSLDQARTLGYVRHGDQVSMVKAMVPSKILPSGYHRLTVQFSRRAFHSWVISAPLTAYRQVTHRLEWGVFAPTYALRSERSWGAGDFTDAEALVSWSADHGSTVFGTLPFLATYLDSPCDPSPYTPISRLFWNEFLLDVTRLPELSACVPAQQLIGSPAFQSALRGFREGRLVEYRGVMELKRRALMLLARQISETEGSRYDTLRISLDRNPELREYACFRAVAHRQQRGWPEWPHPLTAGEINEGDFDPSETLYHCYVQFAASEQVEALKRRCTTESVGLYLDYPLGTHARGFDTWRYRNLFAFGATVGAPPDPVFTTGQDWGFHPILPNQQRLDGYRYLAASLRHQMNCAGMLRIDHVMGLHRLYWVPRGFHKSEGVYVHYPSEEIYAVLSLESHRGQTTLVGENLGIVPGYVNLAMRRHGLVEMNVAYWEMAADPDGALKRMAERPDTVASLNTHDMFPFAAFWHGIDADRRFELGMITQEQAELERWLRGELRGRLTCYLREHGSVIRGEDDVDGALHAVLELLAKSSARWVLINLEDLWLETSPQNIPDTVDQHPNWRQKAKVAIEELIRDDRIHALLCMIQQHRALERNEPRG